MIKIIFIKLYFILPLFHVISLHQLNFVLLILTICHKRYNVILNYVNGKYLVDEQD